MIKDKKVDFKVGDCVDSFNVPGGSLGVLEPPVVHLPGGSTARISKAGACDPDIKDSGGRTEFGSGAVRDAQGGKGRFDLLPKMAIWALAHHWEKGCVKYGDRNWEKGIPIHNFTDSGARHLTEFELGLDDENHLAASIWNLLCAYETLLRIDMGILPGDLDDLPYPLKGLLAGSEGVAAWERFKNFHQPDMRENGGG